MKYNPNKILNNSTSEEYLAYSPEQVEAILELSYITEQLINLNFDSLETRYSFYAKLFYKLESIFDEDASSDGDCQFDYRSQLYDSDVSKKLAIKLAKQMDLLQE